MQYNKLIFEISQKGRIAHDLKVTTNNLKKSLPKHLQRDTDLLLPEVTELDVVRHFTNISNKNFHIEKGFYPLGSCTMKYNPKINEKVAGLDAFQSTHPLTPISAAQGSLQIMFETDEMLSDITGMDKFCLTPFAGAHGELAGLMMIKKYHTLRKDFNRTKIIVPDSAHGTNPATATIVGFEVVEVKSNVNGTVNIDALKELLNEEIAGIMLTNPNTLGIFEKDILEISKLVHGIGGLLYYDGANLNALLGKAKPRAMGFDIIHLNLHKTFGTPHGGGGPGSGVVGVVKELIEYLPTPIVELKDNEYEFRTPINSIGRLGKFYGNFSVILKTYSYIKTLGLKGVNKVGELAVLNANYLKVMLKDDYDLVVNGDYMHEVVFSGLKDKGTGIKTLDIAKRLLDFGVHPPTIYFPLVISEALMIEPTETESKETLDNYIKVLKQIAVEAKENPDLVKNAPYTTPVRRLDEVKAARNPVLKYQDLLSLPKQYN